MSQPDATVQCARCGEEDVKRGTDCPVCGRSIPEPRFDVQTPADDFEEAADAARAGNDREAIQLAYVAVRMLDPDTPVVLTRECPDCVDLLHVDSEAGRLECPTCGVIMRTGGNTGEEVDDVDV